MSLEKMFNPKTIAVIGASRYRHKVGHDVFRNLIKLRKKGVYPINPKAKQIIGKRAYASVNDVKADIDLAVIAVPAKLVPIVMKDCVKKKISAVVIISSGFGEMGNKELEGEVVQIARSGKIDILGPNCLGITLPKQKINATFYQGVPEPGNIAFISQSGALGVAILGWAIQNKIGLRAFVSVGNAANLGFSELIEYFNNDEETKVICLYIESLRPGEGEDFMNAVKKSVKPVIVIKGGLTETGLKAAKSHTAALSTSGAIYKGIFRQCGAIQVDGVFQLFEVARHLGYERAPSGKRGLIITNAGGVGVLASDAFDRYNLKLPQIPYKVMAELNGFLPPHWSHNNPIDITGDSKPERYKKVLEVIEKYDFYDFILFAQTPQTMTKPEDLAKIIINFHKRTKIPSFSCIMGGNQVKKANKMLKEKHILNFKEPSYGVSIISKMIRR